MKSLRPSIWHFVIWCAAGLPMVVVAFLGHAYYSDQMAKGDGTALPAALFSLTGYFGPMIGPIANPRTDETYLAVKWTIVLALFLLVCFCPFLFRLKVADHLFRSAWRAYVFACVLWFFSAYISLGYFGS